LQRRQYVFSGRYGAFGTVQEVRQAWDRTYRNGDYLRVLHTFSDHRTLPEPDRTHFFRAIADVVDRFDGTVFRRYETLLLLARRR
jgi:hypothetical protein